jgi:SNF2 family DNA or RNA helicase
MKGSIEEKILDLARKKQEDEEPKNGSMQSWDEKNKREEKLLEKIAVFTHASLLGFKPSSSS